MRTEITYLKGALRSGETVKFGANLIVELSKRYYQDIVTSNKLAQNSSNAKFSRNYNRNGSVHHDVMLMVFSF